ncbi:hypothetical protein ACHAWF_012131 [Thalassiosira exigua]
MRSSLLPWSCLLAAASSAAAADAPAPDPIDHGRRLTAWLRDHGGYFSPSLELRRFAPDGSDDAATAEASPFYGVVAAKAIPKGTPLFEVPRKLLVTPRAPEVEVGDRIGVWFEQDWRWYRGKVGAVAGDALNVFYDDGATEVVHRDEDHWLKEEDLDVELGKRVTVWYPEWKAWFPGNVGEWDAEARVMGVKYDDGDFETVKVDEAKWEPVTSGDCETVVRLVEEAALGDASLYQPYIDYLLSQPRGQLPAFWSDAGKDLMEKVLGPIEKEDSTSEEGSDEPDTILPEAWKDGYVEEFVEWCTDGKLDAKDLEDQINFYNLLNQRGWDELMIPVMDMMNHGNGRLLNTDHSSAHGVEPVKVWASRDIAKGEDIYTTYNFCPDCGGRFKNYGTSDLLRDYGFVEGFPQRWFFDDQGIAFELDVDESGEHKVNWLNNGPPKSSGFLKEQIDRLRSLSESFPVLGDASGESTIPQHELDVIVRYHQALLIAMTEALKSMARDPPRSPEISGGDKDEL